MRLTADEFDRELRYQTVMIFVRKLLDQGLINEEEYCRIDTKNRAKFRPVTGTLLSGKSLLFMGNGGNMLVGKEARNHENSN
jgi:hypothetical protein